MDWKFLRVTIAGGIGVIVLFLLLLWQPERQVRLHQAHFFRSVEKRDWPKASQFFAANYADRWGHNKENVLGQAAEVFQNFVFLTITQEERSLAVMDGTGIVTTKLHMQGTGSPIADYAMQRVNALSEPFTFRWVKQSWYPWDWQLVEVDQPQLDLSRELSL